MTDDSLNPPPEPPKKHPVKKPGNGASGKRGAGKPAGKAALKLPPFLAKIPLPYLGGGAAGIIMVLFVVIKAVMTPLPVAPQPAPDTAPPVAASEGTTPSPTVAPESAVTESSSAIPAYGKPMEGGISSVDSDLPLVLPYGPMPNELGRRVRMDLAAFEDQTILYETADQPDGSAPGFGVRLPKDWILLGRDANLASGSNLSRTVASYVSPAVQGQRSFLNVHVQKIPFLMKIDDFMTLRAKNDILTYQALSIYGDNRSEALYVTTRDNVSYVVRMASILLKDQVLTAEYAVPADQYDAHQDMQTWVITRFYMIANTVQQTEDDGLKTADFLDLGAFQYPATWSLQGTDIKALDRMRISIINPASLGDGGDNAGSKNLLKGQIDVVMFARDSNTSEPRMIEAMNNLLASQNVHIGEPSGRFDVVPRAGFDLIFARVYPVIDQNGLEQPYQYWLAEWRGSKRFFMVGMLSPRRDQDFSLWVQNYATFRQVMNTLKEGQ